MKLTRSILFALAACVASGAGAQTKFVKFTEPNQKAFTAQIPAGWKTEGGVTLWSPDEAGAMNATESKVDWTVKKDDKGTVLARWLPDVNFIDMTGSPAGGMFQPGQQCNGCIVMPRLGPVNYLLKLVMPRAFPKATNVKVLNSVEVPAAEKALDDLRALLKVPLPLVYKAFLVAVEYDEDGVHYRQLMFAAIEDSIKLGVGLWKSRSACVFRAPAASFDATLPIFTKIHQSIEVNMQWLEAEMKAAEERTGVVSGTFKRIREADAEITKNRRDTNEAIMKQIQKVLTKVE